MFLTVSFKHVDFVDILDLDCLGFNVKHSAQLCDIPAQAVERHQDGLKSKVLFKASKNKAYLALINLINSKLDEFLALLKNVNWTFDEPPEHSNDYMNEIVIYLHAIMSTAIPLDALYKVGCGTLEHISNSIVAAFLSDSIKRFTVNAVTSIDIDLNALDSFADERFHSTGLSEIYKEDSFGSCLIEARQLVSLLSSNQPENFINPVFRERNYYALDTKKVEKICDKYKDSPDGLFGSLSNRSSNQSSRQKSMDVLKKRLKDFN